VEFAYQLHYHVGFRTRRRVPIFDDPRRADFLRETLADICRRNNYRVLEHEINAYWVRLLLSLRPECAPAAVVRTVKANTARWVLECFPEIEREIGRRSLWSRGYYVRGIGDVTNEVVHRYIARQRQHHEVELRNSRELASFAHPQPEQFFDLRPRSHCVAEYNCHFVCSPVNHVPGIEESLAEDLLGYVRRVVAVKQFELITASVLEDHLHLFAALPPSRSPLDFALAVMNNTWHWLWTHNPWVLKLWKAPNFWAPSGFVRTAGAATTAQVRAHLLGPSALVGENWAR
jgi:putative transposase